MTAPLLWLLAGLAAVLVAGWRLVVARRRKAASAAGAEAAAQAALAAARQAAPAAGVAQAPVRRAAPAQPCAATNAPAAATADPPRTPPVPGAPGGVERRSPGRLAADRIIAAEMERRQAQDAARPQAARSDAEGRRAAPEAPVAPSPPARAKAPAAVVALRTPAPVEPPAAATVATRPLAPVVPIARPASRVKTAEQTLVLLADDSKMVRLKTSKLLAAHGFQIATAVDGLDAVQQIEARLPDLVITDVDMPQLDGFGLVRRLRGAPRTAGLPIVMITSAEDRHRAEAESLGVGLVLGKPYPEDTLVAHIRGLAFTSPAEQAPAQAIA